MGKSLSLSVLKNERKLSRVMMTKWWLLVCWRIHRTIDFDSMRYNGVLECTFFIKWWIFHRGSTFFFFSRNEPQTFLVHSYYMDLLTFLYRILKQCRHDCDIYPNSIVKSSIQNCIDVHYYKVYDHTRFFMRKSSIRK